jgi:GTP-binding protein
LHNVALRVEDTADAEKFKVSGRGELHLSVLIENMRREGYELAVSRPEVIFKDVGGQIHEPYEIVTIDINDEHQGTIMKALQERGADLENMTPDGKGRVRLDFLVPSRGLIGFQTDFMTMTSGAGLMYHVFDRYALKKNKSFGQRKNGVLISNGTGKALGFAIFNLQDRGKMMITATQQVYEGQVVGVHSRENDLTVNPLKGKQLTNVRASGTDEALRLVTPIKHTLESALEFIDDDELVEITPESIRIRKRFLSENDRKREGRLPKA